MREQTDIKIYWYKDLLKIDTGTSGTDRKQGKKVYDKRKKILWDSSLQARVNDVIDTLQSPKVMAFPDFPFANQPKRLHLTFALRRF